jgi:uncharacterized membrane protein YqjE
MMDTDHQTPTFGRLAHRTISTCIGALENRAELFALEFEEENDRLIKLVLFGVGGLFFAMLTVLLATGLILYLVPEDYRAWAAFGFALFYLAGAVAAALVIKGLIKQTPFSESLNQIKKDAELLDAFK